MKRYIKAAVNDPLNEGDEVLKGLVKNPRTPSAVLDHLTDAALDVSILFYLAKHPNLSEYAMRKLAESPNYYVRQGVALNEHIPQDLLLTLSEDEDDYVRYGVAKNPKTPVDILVKLSENPGWRTRHGVAENMNTPLEVLDKLCWDSVGDVQEAACDTYFKLTGKPFEYFR